MNAGQVRDLVIRNANRDQYQVVADMARKGVDGIKRRGMRKGIVLLRGEICVYLYLTDSGKTLVAAVDIDPSFGRK